MYIFSWFDRSDWGHKGIFKDFKVILQYQILIAFLQSAGGYRIWICLSLILFCAKDVRHLQQSKHMLGNDTQVANQLTKVCSKFWTTPYDMPRAVFAWVNWHWWLIPWKTGITTATTTVNIDMLRAKMLTLVQRGCQPTFIRRTAVVYTGTFLQTE